MGALIAVACAAPGQVVTPTPAQVATPTPAPTPTREPGDMTAGQSGSPGPSGSPVATAGLSPSPAPIPHAITPSDFHFEIHAAQYLYSENLVDLTAELTYSGTEEQATVYASAGGLVEAGFSSDGGSLEFNVLQTDCAAYVFERGVPLRIPVANDLRLSLGQWSVYLRTQLTLDDVDCSWRPDSERDDEIQLDSGADFTVVDFPVLPVGVEGCDGPPSAWINGKFWAPLTMLDEYSARDGSDSYEVDYGVWETSVPSDVLEVDTGGNIHIQGPRYSQLMSGYAERYWADEFVETPGEGASVTGERVELPLLASNGGLDVTAPIRAGNWVVHVRFRWLTPCAVADSEINFRVETR